MILKTYLTSAPLFGLTFAAVYNSVDELKSNVFDFIVIGGGTAGAVVANRLSERPDFNVLVIEAGPTNEGVLDAIVPWLATKIQVPDTIYDWNYTTAPGIGINNQSLFYSRAHILGGCSSHNDMVYTRGSSDDYDRFAAVTGDSGWSWKKILPYMLKAERWSPPADHHNTKGQFDPSVHGTNGVLLTSISGFPLPIDDMVLTVPKQLPSQFPFLEDMNAGRPLGLGWTQVTIGNGARSGAAVAYLSSNYTSRRNLNVLLNTKVNRVLSTTNTTSFNQVDISGSSVKLTARKELILSAGTINTPQILLNSGIGDSQTLQSLGIRPVLNISSVGKGLHDQPASFVVYSVNSNNTLDNLANNATLQAEALAQWQKGRTGPYVDNGLSQISWSRLPAGSPILEQFGDPSAGPNTPHIELGPMSGFGQAPPGHYVAMYSVLVTPSSRGSVSLNKADRFGSPVIDPGYYTAPFDIPAMREAIRLAQKFYQAPVWNDYIKEQIIPPPNVTSDADLEAWLRSNTFANLHPVGTASMSPKGASTGVVNPDLLVKNARGLRIVDASVMVSSLASGKRRAHLYATLNTPQRHEDVKVNGDGTPLRSKVHQLQEITGTFHDLS